MTSKENTTTSSSKKTKTRTKTTPSKKEPFPAFKDSKAARTKRAKVLKALGSDATTKSEGAKLLLLTLVEEQLRLQDYHAQLLKHGVSAEVLSRSFAQPSKMLLKLLDQLGLGAKTTAKDDDDDDLGFD